MSNQNNNLLLVGGLGVAAYLLFGKSSTLPTATTPTPGITVPAGTIYPYLVAAAPAIPSAYNQAYYIVNIRPAMAVVNPNINNPGYTLSQTDANNYYSNYKDLQQWVLSFKTGTLLSHLQYHWHTYGVADQRTFLPLPWSTTTNWIAPPVNANASGSGDVLTGILKAAVIVGGGIAEVATAGSLTSVIVPATVAVEASIHGLPTAAEYALNDTEIELIMTAAAVIKKILPFYLEVQPALVTSIENKLNELTATYA